MVFQDCSAIATKLQIVTPDQCATLLQQFRRLLVQRSGNASTVTTTTALILATWTALLAATGNTAISSIQSLFYEPDLTGSEPVTVGSNDNSTPSGRTQIVGETIPKFSGMFTGLSPAMFGQIDALFAEGRASADIDRLTAYFLCGDNQLLMLSAGGGIPIRAPYIGNPTGGQLHKLTQFNVTFELDKNWYRNAAVLTLPFNHSLLVNP